MSRKKRKSNPRNRKRNVKEFTPKHNTVVKNIEYYEGITVGELAQKCNRNASDVIKILFMLGNMVTINSMLDDESVELVCLEFNITPKKVDPLEEEDSLLDDEVDDPKDLKPRAPIVTIMGHVDHGKTTLLDSIRKTKVVEGEFGGITQHIGAYQVGVDGKLVTFLDTPGHEAFTAMRARGAKVTDLVVIVVAADDSVMPQTKEAVDHAKAADVPIIVAINKIDKPTANPDRVMNEMADLGLTPEEWGGDTIYVQTSAKLGTGIKDLLETILVLSEVKDLKANPNRIATGTVIEAKLDKGRGPVATLLIQNGTLNFGDFLVVGTTYGKVRKMTDDMGEEIKSALPSTPVEIIGLSEVPEAGDMFKVFDDEREARLLAQRRNQVKIEQERKQTSAMSLEELTQRIAEGEAKEIPMIIKADVQGSAEAVKASMEKLEVEDVRINVIRSTAGAISESDVMLAEASGAVIIGFNVRPDANVRKMAGDSGVSIRLHKVIYKALEEVESAMKGLLNPVFEEVVIGQAEVRQIYKASKVGTIAGCMVQDGKIIRDCNVRLIRDGIVVYDGKLGSLKRFQNDAKEVSAGYECGLTIENFNDIKEGDLVEAYKDQEVPIE
ncbi:MAG: translation initiation factor IF-2 [Bacillota bacterium]|jgi:translation initiation factor IF-2|nr:translation initiation factor IF-2 [Bacillota bacterium]NLP22613.1 translation initiation factor IF-2 [Erysipelotrichaceae bacterium]